MKHLSCRLIYDSPPWTGNSTKTRIKSLFSYSSINMLDLHVQEIYIDKNPILICNVFNIKPRIR